MQREGVGDLLGRLEAEYAGGCARLEIVLAQLVPGSGGD